MDKNSFCCIGALHVYDRYFLSLFFLHISSPAIWTGALLPLPYYSQHNLAYWVRIEEINECQIVYDICFFNVAEHLP